MPSSPSSPSPSEESDISSSDHWLSSESSPLESCSAANLRVAAALILLLALILGGAFLIVGVAIVLAGVRIGIGLGLALDQLEIAKQLGRKRRERRLVVEREAERVEIAAGLALDPIRNQRQRFARSLGRRLPGQPLAHNQPDRGAERHLLPAARPHQRIGPQPKRRQLREIGAHPRHRPRAKRLDPRLLGRVEHGPGDIVRRRMPVVQFLIVMPKPKRRRVGEPPRLRRLLRPKPAARHRRLDALARSARHVAGEAELHLMIPRQRPSGAGQRQAKCF